jgi:hypothetical protein
LVQILFEESIGVLSMASTGKYKNLANSDHPATLIYLVDISSSMRAAMPDGRSRIEAVKDAIHISYTQMIQRSLKQGKIRPKYRIGMVAYSDDIYDVYGAMGSIITVDKLKDEGVPLITPQKGTNMAKAFRYAIKLIQDDIISWSERWLNECPPPMVINITDCEYGEDTQDPVMFAKQLQEISVPDGNVLVENIFITDQITLSSQNIKDWNGYSASEATGDPYGDKLLAMSSRIPAGYAQIMSEQAGLKIREGTAMMFPGVSQEFIKTGFVMSMVTGIQLRDEFHPKYIEDRDNINEEMVSKERLSSHREAMEKAEAERPAKQKAEREDKRPQLTNKFKISIAYPKQLSKRFPSIFLCQIYLPEAHTKVLKTVKAEFKDKEINNKTVHSFVRLGQKIKIRLFHPFIIFSEPNPILINYSINKIKVLGTPNDNCESGLHEVLVSISDFETGLEIETLAIKVRVADYAFDHVPRPLLSSISAVVLGVGSFAMFILTFLEQIDKTVGLTSGTAAGVFAIGIYASFYNLYQRVRPNTP